MGLVVLGTLGLTASSCSPQATGDSSVVPEIGPAEEAVNTDPRKGWVYLEGDEHAGYYLRMMCEGTTLLFENYTVEGYRQGVGVGLGLTNVANAPECQPDPH